jgi:transposase
LQREFARAPRGGQVEDTVPGNLFERVNVIGALWNGSHCAVECYRQATNKQFFEDWFENTLLAIIPRGHTVIMDNASFHRKKQLRKLARGKARLLFLPPYSPDYNPIEQSWANMKRHLRDTAQYFPSVHSSIYDHFGYLVS